MIETIIDDERWLGALPDAQALAKACYQQASMAEAGLRGEIALMLTSDEKMRALNQRFRQKDAPTNVLSFPAGGAIDGFVGDIAIGREICDREAREKHIALRDHTAHLIIHGMLHLVGYDHHTDDDARMMEQQEADILSAMGVPDPYDAAEGAR